MSVLAIGELLADMISDDYVGSLSEARMFRMHQGGSPANMAANLKYLGAEAQIVSCVGADGIGDFIVEAIKKIGLSDAHIARNKYYPSSLVLVGKSRATPDFIAYRMADTQIGEVDERLIDDAAIVHSCAFALSKAPSRISILNAFKKAAAAGKQVSADWNFAPSIWQPDDGQDVFREVCSLNPLLKFSMDDAERFWGRSLTAEAAMLLLDPLPTRATCLTCGGSGVWYKSRETPEWQHIHPEPVETLVDTTGAGDAFWAGFLFAWERNFSMTDAVKEGLKIAARKISKIGPLYESW